MYWKHQKYTQIGWRIWWSTSVKGNYLICHGIKSWDIYWPHSDIIWDICACKQHNASKLLCLFSETLDVIQKTAFRWLYAAKSKLMTIRSGSMVWSSTPKWCSHTKIIECVKNILTNRFYNILSLCSRQWVIIVSNYIYRQAGPQLVPKLLLQVLVSELHTRMVIQPEIGGLKVSRNEVDNIIISDWTLFNILPPQLNTMTSQ